ncbi:hypothetical protein D3C72_2162710 [compost metagenome]
MVQKAVTIEVGFCFLLRYLWIEKTGIFGPTTGMKSRLIKADLKISNYHEYSMFL